VKALCVSSVAGVRSRSSFFFLFFGVLIMVTLLSYLPLSILLFWARSQPPYTTTGLLMEVVLKLEERESL
jgi:hypothetical protein